MSWHRADNDLLSAGVLGLLSVLPGTLGAAALGYLSALRSWCSDKRTTEIPEAVLVGLGRLLRLGVASLRQVVSALAAHGYLEQASDGGARLLDEAVVRPPAPARPETGKAARQRRYKEKAKGRRQASPEASPGDGGEASPEEMGRRLPGVSQGDGGASPEASPLASPSPPIPPHPRTSTGTGTGTREEGAPAAAPVSHFSTTNEPHPSATRPKAKPKKPSPKRTLPARAQLAAAYAAGVSAVTGAPCSPPSERWALDDLEAMLATHAPGVVGAEALGWLTSAAQDFATAKAEDRWTLDKGFPPKMARSWLDGGNRPPPSAMPPVSPPPPPGVISPHPGRRVRPAWLDEPDEFSTSNLFAEGAAQ